MEFRVQRAVFYKTCTIGRLFVGKTFRCFTLEPPLVKAIPQGTYPLTIDFSNRFQKLMPHICDVPGFTGIRIHPGNTPEDTTGCILVGNSWGHWDPAFVGESRAAYNALFQVMALHCPAQIVVL